MDSKGDAVTSDRPQREAKRRRASQEDLEEVQVEAKKSRKLSSTQDDRKDAERSAGETVKPKKQRPMKEASVLVKKLPESLPRRSLWTRSGLVIGIDEAGRGPWAGPLVVGAVAVLPGAAGALKALAHGVTDSKHLDEQQREYVYKLLMKCPNILWAVTVIGHNRIDKINILEATFEGMTKSHNKLVAAASRQGQSIGRVLVDGNKVPPKLVGQSCKAIIGGDRTHFAIAAASIIAKVTRDRMMAKLALKYPQYGFKAHKGYGTAHHRAMLKQHGPSAVHRRSYEPLKGFLESGEW